MTAGFGTLPLVNIMMGKDEHSARSQILGCKILAALATDPAVRKVIGGRNLVEKVVGTSSSFGLLVSLMQ